MEGVTDLQNVGKVSKIAENVMRNAAKLDPFAATLNELQSVSIVKKTLKNAVKQASIGFRTARDEIMTYVCDSIRDFKALLKSTIALAKQQTVKKRSEFVEIMNRAGDPEDGVQYVEGMMRQLALGEQILEQANSKTDQEPDEKKKPISLLEWKNHVLKYLQAFGEDLQKDMRAFANLTNLALKYIEDAMLALTSIERTMKKNAEYPLDIERKEAKIKRALGVGNIYHEECSTAKVEG